MTILRRIMIAFLTVATLATGVVQAASTTNFSDPWWTEGQSGWGMSVQQQNDVLFIALLVYGTDNQPAWFTASAFHQINPATGPFVFTGDLYLTNGPYYGAAWNPAALSYRKVGTLTFDAATANNATLTYTVDGTPFVKNVTRLTLSYENLGGTYYGGWNGDRPQCINGPANQTHFEDPLTITVAKNTGSAVTVTLRFGDGGSESFSGTYTQSGHLGRIDGVFPDGMGEISVSEIEITSSGFTGRFEGHLVTSHWRDWCFMKSGRIGGVLR